MSSFQIRAGSGCSLFLDRRQGLSEKKPVDWIPKSATTQIWGRRDELLPAWQSYPACFLYIINDLRDTIKTSERAAQDKEFLNVSYWTGADYIVKAVTSAYFQE